MSLTNSSFSLSSLIAPWRQSAAPQSSPRPAPMFEVEETGLDRAFLYEMMLQHPEAIHSELGLMTLLARR